MNGENKFGIPPGGENISGNHGMQCAEFEALTADALDHILSEEDEQRFQAHLARCASCAPMFHEAQAGLQWLSALKQDEAEPPSRMVENILRATVGTSPIPKAAKPEKSWWEQLKGSPYLAPVLQSVLQPRFAMGFGMAFFSITMLLNLAGVKVNNIRRVDLRPAAIVTAYYETTGKIVKYWENIRFVYEIETRVRDLKKATTPQQKSGPQTNEKESKTDSNRETSELRNWNSQNSQVAVVNSIPATADQDGPQRLEVRQRRLS